MWLTIRSEKDHGRTVRVEGGEFLIGRVEGCDLVIDDSKVSRRHASIEPRPGGRAILRDLGSGNGTFVNGKRVERAELAGGEQIQVGETVLVSSLEEPGRIEGGTVLESATAGGIVRPRTHSAIQRLVLQRSVRRATVLGSAAVALALAVGIYFLLSKDETAKAVQRVVQKVAPSTVYVEAQHREAKVEAGTGWVLDAGRGLIVTNAHVVNGGSAFKVGVASGPRDATIVGVAPCEDLALLRVGETAGLKSLPLGSQSSLGLGETVVAVGYPGSAAQETRLTSTTGVVSVAKTTYREQALDIPHYPNVVQTDAAINPGNSGGPLLDLDARLVGVNSAGRTLAPDGRIIQGQNYAVGVDRVKEVTARLGSGHSIGWTGVGFEYPTPKELERRGLPPGLLTSAAVPGTGADRAGLGAEGTLITEINGFAVTNSLASYCDAVRSIGSGRRATFKVLTPGAPRPRAVRVRFE